MNTLPPDMPNVPEVPPLERDVYCPRCDYNLRGLTRARCPECGLVFAAEDFVAGDLRENVPTRLDRCDLALPHRVLWLSLCEMVAGAVRPGRRFRTLDVKGPLKPAVWMFVCGVLWLYLLATVLVAVAIWRHHPVSPAAAVRGAGLWFVPRMMVVALGGSLLAVMTGSAPWLLPGLGGRPRWHMRLLLYMTPALMLLATVPIGVWLIVGGEGAVEVVPAGCLVPFFAIVPHLFSVMRLIRGRALPRSDWYSLIYLVLMLLFFWPMLRGGVMPETLEPPVWVFGLGE